LIDAKPSDRLSESEGFSIDRISWAKLATTASRIEDSAEGFETEIVVQGEVVNLVNHFV
jgi:hypothetical protein